MNISRSLLWALLLIGIGLYGVLRSEELLSFRGIAGMVATVCGLATLVMALYARRTTRQQQQPPGRC